jgi:hypothetical protein
MGGILQVDTIQNNNATTLITQTNTTTLTFGVSGQNIVIPSGVTFNTASATVTLPSTINATTINVTTLVLAAGAVGTPSLTTSGDTNTGIFFPSADTIAFTEGGTEAMRITSDGNVGIGTSSPAAALTTNPQSGNFSATVTDYAGVGHYILGRGTAGVGNYGPAIVFGACDSTELEVNKHAAISSVQTGSDPNEVGLSFWTHPSSIRANPLVENMRIDSSGGLILTGSTAQKATGTTWSNPSDTRLKNNKQNYTKGLNELLQINVKTWEWNGKAGTTEGTTGIGVIADEIEVLLPNTVDTYKAKLNIDDTEETDVKRFDATEITWLLLNSIKELSAKNDVLEATSTSQQTKIDALEARLTALENN